jgi:ABC-type transport system substrate-binding protein
MWANSALNDLFWTYPIASPTAFKKMGKEGMEKHPVGTGPFKFDSMQNDNYIKFVRNENYWQKGLPYLDSIEWKIIIDPNTALNSFLANEVDVALQLSGDLVANLKGRKDIELVDPVAPIGLLGAGLIGNSADPKSPFADVRVRKAISYAINKKDITEVLYHGFAVPVNQYSLKGAWSYDPNIDPYDFNPEKAKQLLKEAGYPNGFSTKLIGHASHRTWLTAVQGYLAEVGIKAEVVIVEPARFNAMAMTDGWDGLIGYFFLTDNELSTIINPHFGPNTAIYGTYALRPEKVQKLNDQFNAETDFEKRKQLAHELQSTILDEYHLFTPLFVSKTPYLKYSKVQDDQFYTQNGMLFSPEKMWIKKK